MDENPYTNLALPPEAWQSHSAAAALRSRDVPAILRIAQAYSGASQARLAAALRMGQGRVNEIINGRRQVGSFEVFERLAAGLALPDDARMLLGLAPARASGAGSEAGIVSTYARQGDVNDELRAHAGEAEQIDILAVRALGLLALNDSLLRGALLRRQTPATLRVLLLAPDSASAATRAAEIAETPESFSAGIRLAAARIAELNDHPHLTATVRLYDQLPTWRLLRFDDTSYLSGFGARIEGHRSSVCKLTAGTGGMLHAGFTRHFDDLWRRSA